jgi:hypothetical protein
MYRPPSVICLTTRSGGRAILGKGWEPLRRVPAGLSFRPQARVDRLWSFLIASPMRRPKTCVMLSL